MGYFLYCGRINIRICSFILPKCKWLTNDCMFVISIQISVFLRISFFVPPLVGCINFMLLQYIGQMKGDTNVQLKDATNDTKICKEHVIMRVKYMVILKIMVQIVQYRST